MSSFKIDVTEVESCRKKVQVTVPSADVKKFYDKAVEACNASARLPGFRPGKAPRNILMQKHGAQIVDTVRRQLLDETFNQLLKDEATAPIGSPELDLPEVSETADCTMTLTYDVNPTFSLPDYRSLKLAKKAYVEDAAKVESALSDVAERFSTLTKVDRAAATGDFVKVDFTSNLPAEGAAKDMAAGTGRWFPLNERSIVPGLAAALTGKSAGEKASWTAEFTADSAIPELAGKSAQFEATLVEVHGKNAPAIDDELAKKAGLTTVVELRERVTENLKRGFEGEETGRLKEEALDQLLAGFECPLPPTVLRKEIERNFHALQHQHGHDHDCNTLNPDDDAKLKEEATIKATRDLKARFILKRIAKLEKVSVSQYEVQMQLYIMAQHYGVKPDALAQQLQSTNSMQEFVEHVQVDKALATVVELATKA